ncbi:MAG: class IV adenylate cyclase [Halobacteriales archaeon]
MEEVELKLPAENADLEVRLRRVGFERRGRYRQVDRYYAVPHRDLAVTDEALRLRTVEDLDEGAVDHRVTYKGPRVGGAGAKARREITTAVESVSAAEALLEAIDCEVAGEVRKVRERYARGDATVALDEVDGLGSFVELERVVPAADVSTARTEIESLAAALGLDGAVPIERTYLELVLEDEPQ